MRFQTTEMVPHQDAELVLEALVHCLREISTDVTRTGPEIVLHGLGPSPLATNPRDITVIHVKSEDGRTIIDADVSFQASALIGDAPQDEVVRSKLDRVFDRMKMQIEEDRDKRFRAHFFEMVTSPIAVVEPHPPAADPPPVSATAEGEPIEPASEEIQPAAEEMQPVAESIEPEEEIPQTPEPVSLDPVYPVYEEPQAAIAEPPAPHPPTPSEIPAPLPEPQLQFHRTPSGPIPHRRRFAAIAAIAASLLVVLPGFYLARYLHPPRRVLAAHAAPAYATPHLSPPASTAPITPSTTPAPIASSTTTATPSAPATKQELQASDPKIWLQNWVAATRTRDAAAQASFYSNPVDHYLGKRNISNADVLAEKRASILNREGLWTVKLEEIGMHRINDNNVSIYLVKHFMAETEPAQISEQFVPSHLQLRRINGEWKITSEEDLQPTATPSDHVPSD